MEPILEYQTPQACVFVPSPPSMRSDEVLKTQDKLNITACFFTVCHVARVEHPATKLMDDWWYFQRLKKIWHEERGATSSISRIATCPAYQSIIAMGPAAFPHIFRQLESEGDEPDMWFWALKALAQGYDPVPESDRGDFRAMAQAWLKWGRKRYAW